MKPIKILVVNPTAIVAGGTIVSNGIIAGLPPAEFEISVFFPEIGAALDLVEQRKNVHVITPKSGGLIGIVRSLRRAIREYSPDILHAHGSRAKFLAWFALMGFSQKPKFIYTVHGFHIVRRKFPLNRILELFERVSNYWSVDEVVCVSEMDKSLMLRHRVITPDKVRVIHNGIDIDRYRTSPDIAAVKKKELGIGLECVILSIARLHPQKDIATLLTAMKHILDKRKDVRLLLVGDGPLRHALERQANILGISPYVKFLGIRSDIPELLAVADVVVLSTNWEGLPLVPLEAGAAKKPIVASDVEGVWETIVGGKTGYLFRRGDAKDLADKINDLLDSEPLRKIMGEAGYRFVLENFNLGAMVEAYRRLYEEITRT